VRHAGARAARAARARGGRHRRRDGGEVLDGRGKLWVAEPDGAVTTHDTPLPDPYWPAYERAVRERWR